MGLMRPGPRKLKIGCLHQPRTGNRYIRVPALKLTGLWMERIGFREGEQVEVTVTANAITLTLVASFSAPPSSQRELF